MHKYNPSGSGLGDHGFEERKRLKETTLAFHWLNHNDQRHDVLEDRWNLLICIASLDTIFTSLYFLLRMQAMFSFGDKYSVFILSFTPWTKSSTVKFRTFLYILFL